MAGVDEHKTETTGAPSGEAGKVIFTPEQQERVDKLIDGKFTEAFEKAGATFQPKITNLEKTVEELKMELATKSKGKDSTADDAKEKDLSDLQKRVATMEEEKKQSLKRDRFNQIKAMASDANAVNSDQVAQLMTSHIGTGDNGKLIVLNSEGHERVGVDVKDFIAEFMKDNPHLLKSNGSQGAGSQGAGFNDNGGGKTIKRSEFDKLPSDEKHKIAIGKEVAIID